MIPFSNNELLKLPQLPAGALTGQHRVMVAAPTGVDSMANPPSTVTVDQIQAGGAKVYRALLAQTLTNAPVATVFDNTIGTIVWTRTAQGNYLGTLVGGFTDNTFLQATSKSAGTVVSVSNVNNDSVQYITWGTGDAASADGAQVFIEILVYPA